jgi:hypothetical protein
MPTLRMVKGSVMSRRHHKSRKNSSYERTVRCESRYCIILGSCILLPPSNTHGRGHSLRTGTVELIVEQASWSPTQKRKAGATLMGVRVGVKEVGLQRQVKQAGGRWNPAARVWEIPYSQAIALGLKNRIEKQRVSNSRHP